MRNLCVRGNVCVGVWYESMDSLLNKVVSRIIQDYHRKSIFLEEPGMCGKRGSMSRFKKPCTRCHTMVSPTWRPGPCGSSTLCNACGVLYMDREHRTRMVDLILHGAKPMWISRNTKNFQWALHREANLKDERIRKWTDHEMERQSLRDVERKRRKIACC